MRVAPASPRHLGEQRRYFPDWAEHLLASLSELEADHNSYLASGYAEEFGYRAQPGYSRGVPVLDEEVPELCSERYAQARATHPGYPLKPHPLAPKLDMLAERRLSGRMHADTHAYEHRSVVESGNIGRLGKIIVVSEQSNARKRKQLARRVALVPIQLASVMIQLRWIFARRYRLRESVERADADMLLAQTAPTRAGSDHFQRSS